MISINWRTTRFRQLPEGGDEEVIERGIIQLDVLESESYSITSEVTSHAVEEGVEISDHTNPKQDRVSAEVFVPETPLDPAIVNGASFETFELANGVSATALKIPEGTTRINDVFQTLRNLSRDGTQIDVEGFSRPLEGWLIENVERTRSVQDASGFSARIELTEVRIAETVEVEAPSPRVERGRRRRNRGQQSAANETKAQTARFGSNSNQTGQREPQVTQPTGSTGTDIRNAQSTAANPANNSTTTSNIRQRATQ